MVQYPNIWKLNRTRDNNYIFIVEVSLFFLYLISNPTFIPNNKLRLCYIEDIRQTV